MAFSGKLPTQMKRQRHRHSKMLLSLPLKIQPGCAAESFRYTDNEALTRSNHAIHGARQRLPCRLSFLAEIKFPSASVPPWSPLSLTFTLLLSRSIRAGEGRWQKP